MKNHAQELFLMATTLSQLSDKDRIVDLFMESMNDIFREYSFAWTSKEPTERDSVIEVCTRHKNYGFVSLMTEGLEDATIHNLICNAAQLLAIFLEKLEQENLLLNQKNHLQVLVDRQTSELHQANLQLENELVVRMHAEEELESRNALLSALLDSPSDIIIFALDSEYRYTAFNEQHRREMMKIWNAEIRIGMNLLECMSIPELKENAKQSIDRALCGEAFSEIKFQPGPDIYYEFRWNPIFQNESIIGITSFISNITESKRAEDALRESEEKYRTLIQKIQAAVVVHNADTRIVTCNSKAQEILGLTEDQILGKKAIDPNWHFFREDGSRMPLEEFPVNRVIATRGELREYTAGVHRPDGSDIFALVNADPVFNREDEILQVIVTFFDITEQKKAEQERMAHLHFLESISNTSRAIHESNDLEKMMTDVLDVIISIFDCDRAWLVYPCDPDAATWSVSMERAKPGYSGPHPPGVEIAMDDEVAEGFRLQLSTDNPVKFGPGTEDLSPGNLSQRFGFQSCISVALYPRVGKPWQFEMQQCSYARQWTVQEEKLFQEMGGRLEDALTSLLSYRNLQESEERYRLVFENSPVSILEEDFSDVKDFLDGLRNEGVNDIENYFTQHFEDVQRCADLVKIIDVNRASLALHGASEKEELLGGLTKTFTAESFHTFRKKLIYLWNGSTEMQSDTVVKRLNGDVRDVTISFTVCPGYQETLSRVIVSIIDITERKRTEEALRLLNMELDQRVLDRTAQLERLNKELEAFAYSVSHDLRAPLRHIDGFLALLISRYRDRLDEKGIHYMDTIADSAHKMEVLIDDLLQFSRTGRVEMHQDTINMNHAVDDVLIQLKESYADRKIEWIIGEFPAVRGDYTLLRQVWSNLLENAIKYTRTQEVARIEIGARREGDETLFFITDNGVGFDMKYIEKLFGVFQRLHSVEEFEGTGIGLAIVHRIITRHNGRVWAEARPDEGATFYFTLPTQEENHV